MTNQWTLNRLNFEGCWQGRGCWHVRDSEGDLNFATPTRVITPTRYAISFSDEDTGVWDGSGLFFAPDGKATYAISRDSYNAGGGCWQFAGAGGQSSRRLDAGASRFGHEINLFQARSRSMLVLIWEPIDHHWRLQVVGAVGFRCLQGQSVEPERPICASPEALLEPLRGWQGSSERLTPSEAIQGQPSAPQPVVFDPEQLLRHDCSAVMADGLVFSVPEQLPNAAFRLEIGGLLGPALFQQVSVLFDSAGTLTAWQRSTFQATRI